MAKPPKDEIVREYYGINSKTFEVECVSETRGGTLSKFTKSGGYHTHRIHPGASSSKAEVALVYDLIEIEDVHAQYTSSEQRKAVVDRLRARADVLKLEDGQ